MKKIVLFLALIGTGSTAFAESRSELAQAYCKSLYQIADMAMSTRQQDLPAYETSEFILKIVSDAGSTKEMQEVALSIVENAYKRPLIEDTESKKVIIDAFKESYYFKCMTVFKDEK